MNNQCLTNRFGTNEKENEKNSIYLNGVSNAINFNEKSIQ
jgi:hypothetical protein